MDAPLLSVVVAGSRPEGPPAELWEVLGPDLASGRVEALVATARPTATPIPPGARLLAHPPGTPVPRLRAAGLRAARAPLVALTEDFCAPAPGWVAALLDAHARTRAIAVGGPVARTDGRAVDWALTLCEYARFFPRGPAGPVADLPGINVSYKREALFAALGGAPDAFVETQVHARLAADGAAERAPEAVMFDRQRRAFGAALASFRHHGRLYGGNRVAGRPFPVRLVRAVAAPLAPAVQALRLVRDAGPVVGAGPLLRAAPFALALLASWAVGEAVGSLAGPGRSLERWT